MVGTVKNVIAKKAFGFVRAAGKEYFFHKDDFIGHWDDLVNDHEHKHGDKDSIPVEFDVIPSAKGPRASKVRRTDHPNQSV